MVKLQWGRVQMNAEVRLRRVCCRREYASMGPRSHERGSLLAHNLTARLEKLQWGRVQMNAEVATTSLSGSQNADASMGPRSDERGSSRAGAGITYQR